MRTYLGFSVEYEGVEKYYVFNVAPFGLATSGLIYSELVQTRASAFDGKLYGRNDVFLLLVRTNIFS